jgi:hypothetical protein
LFTDALSFLNKHSSYINIGNNQYCAISAILHLRMIFDDKNVGKKLTNVRYSAMLLKKTFYYSVGIYYHIWYIATNCGKNAIAVS